jgi:ABC-2 type transport system permease protein
MIVYANQIRRILRNKLQFLFLIIFPVAFMLLSLSEPELKLSAAIIDHDQSEASQALSAYMGEGMKLSVLEEQDIPRALMERRVDYALVVEKEFAEKLQQGDLSGVHGYGVDGINASKPAQLAVERFLLEKSGALSPGSGRTEAIDGMSRKQTRSAFGLMTIGIFMTGSVMSTMIIQDRNNKTLFRNMSAPMRLRAYMLQVVAAMLTVSFLQVIYLLAVIRYGFGFYIGTNPLALFVLFALSSAVAAAMGVWFVSFSKTIMQAIVFSLLNVTLMCMLGGAYWSLDFMPEKMQAISRLVPVSWLMNGAEKVLYGGGWEDIGGSVLVLVLFAAVFFMLGTLKKTDTAH